ERPARGGDRALRVLPARARDASPRFLGGGVDRVGGLAAFGVTELAVDVELIVGHGCLLPRRGGARHGGRGSRVLGASPSGGQRDPAPETTGAGDGAGPLVRNARNARVYWQLLAVTLQTPEQQSKSDVQGALVGPQQSQVAPGSCGTWQAARVPSGLRHETGLHCPGGCVLQLSHG